MKTTRNYIKNLEYRFFTNFGKLYLTVTYIRGGEFNDVTYSNVPVNMRHDEKSVRKYINK